MEFALILKSFKSPSPLESPTLEKDLLYRSFLILSSSYIRNKMENLLYLLYFFYLNYLF